MTDQKHARAVAQKQANPWGFFDLNGNVAEWCQDGYGPYPAEAVTDPCGVGSRRVNRGGNWTTVGGACRSARRGHDPATAAYEDLGFRLVAAREEPAAAIPGPEQNDVFVCGGAGVPHLSHSGDARGRRRQPLGLLRSP